MHQSNNNLSTIKTISVDEALNCKQFPIKTHLHSDTLALQKVEQNLPE